jgi:hypothetical protein
MKTINPLIILLFAITVLVACKKDDSKETPMEVVTGYVHYYDINGRRSADNSGITVSIEGDTVSTTTNSNGRWTLSKLNTGTYTFAFSKPGYGTMKVYGMNLAGGYQSVDTMALYPIPQYTITIPVDSAPPAGGIYVYGIFHGTIPSAPGFHMFFGKDSNVSADQATYSYDYASSMTGSVESIPFEVVFPNELFTQNGFASGDTVYLVAYTDYLIKISYNSEGTVSYLDMNTNKIVYPNINPVKSNIGHFVLP